MLCTYEVRLFWVYMWSWKLDHQMLMCLGLRQKCWCTGQHKIHFLYNEQSLIFTYCHTYNQSINYVWVCRLVVVIIKLDITILLCDCLIRRIVLIAHCTGAESRADPCTNIFCLEPNTERFQFPFSVVNQRGESASMCPIFVHRNVMAAYPNRFLFIHLVFLFLQLSKIFEFSQSIWFSL